MGVAVGLAVAVGVAVRVAVGFRAPLAEPVILTTTERFPEVALLVTGIVAMNVPDVFGANSTVTTTAARGESSVVP